MQVIQPTETGEFKDGNLHNFFPDCVVMTRVEPWARGYNGHGLMLRWRGAPDVPPPVGVQSLSIDTGGQYEDITVSLYPDPDPSKRITWVQVSLGYLDPVIPYLNGLSNVTGVIRRCTTV